MYTERTYVTDLRNELTAVLNELDAEFTKQGRRANRESEKRTRKLLAGLPSRLYRPYKKASLADLGQNKAVSSDSQNEGV